MKQSEKFILFRVNTFATFWSDRCIKKIVAQRWSEKEVCVHICSVVIIDVQKAFSGLSCA